MAWVLDNVRIFVQDKNDTFLQTIARLQPLNSLTVHHIFGEESEVVGINAYIVGSGDRQTIIDMDRDGAVHVLSGPYGIYYDDMLVHSAKFKLTNSTCQTLRTDLPEDSPVYIVDLELYRDES
jgi:hypothetical protein